MTKLTIDEKSTINVGVHGNAILPARDLEIYHKDTYASVILRNGARQLRYALPTPTFFDTKPLRAGRFDIRFCTYDSTRICYVRIFDGDGFVGGKKDISWSGQSVVQSFDLQMLRDTVWGGLSITVGVESDDEDTAFLNIMGLGVTFYTRSGFVHREGRVPSSETGGIVSAP